jgi:hypothetical protein
MDGMFLGNNFLDIEHILLYAATFEEYPIDRKLEFVKEWAMKSQKWLFTLADIPHVWRYFAKRQNFDAKSLKILTWSKKAMMNSGNYGYTVKLGNKELSGRPKIVP